MAKQKFLARLIPPRPTFAEDATPDEIALMREHLAYMQTHFAAGRLLLFGPVFAESGTYGVAVMDVDDIAEVHEFMRNDPSVLAGLNTYDVSKMHLAGAQSPRADSLHE